MPNENQTQELIKKIVIARLGVLPSNIKISIGSEGDFSKEELIEHVENGDDIGDKMIAVELEYLRDLKEGILYANNSANY